MYQDFLGFGCFKILGEYISINFNEILLIKRKPDQGSLELAHSIGWNQQIDSYEDGYKKAFDELKSLNIIPNKF